MSSPATKAVTFLGIGNMGCAAVLALLKAGTSVTIWNRTTTRPHVKKAIDAGATLEPNLSKAISATDTIIICLLDYATITTAFSNLDDHPPKITNWPNKTIINLTNGTPRQSHEMETFFLKEKGARVYLDGAIMVTPQMVGGPHSFLVLSGGGGQDETSFTSSYYSKILSGIGRPQYLGPEIAAAARFDLAALSSMYGMFAGAFVGMGFLKRGGGGGGGDTSKSPNPEIGQVVKGQIVPFLTALVPYLGGIAEMWDKEDWMDNMGNPVGMQLEGVRNILEACREDGIKGAAVLEELGKLMQRAVERHGEDSGVAFVGALMLE